MASSVDLTAEVVRMKAAYRLEANAKSWPEKVASIERMRLASAMAKEGMRKTREEADAMATQGQRTSG
jgi:hypothetical protein